MTRINSGIDGQVIWKDLTTYSMSKRIYVNTKQTEYKMKQSNTDMCICNVIKKTDLFYEHFKVYR